MSEFRIYHLRIVPPEPVYSDIINFKQQFRETYGNLKYSKSKPHITLAFFGMDTNYENEMIECFAQLSTIKGFHLQIPGFGTFDRGSNVLFLDVANSPSIIQIQTKARELWLGKLKEKTSELTISKNPHMTISTTNDKDTLLDSFNKFNAIGYENSFEVDHLVLTSRLMGKTWDREYNISLSL